MWQKCFVIIRSADLECSNIIGFYLHNLFIYDRTRTRSTQEHTIKTEERKKRKKNIVLATALRLSVHPSQASVVSKQLNR